MNDPIILFYIHVRVFYLNKTNKLFYISQRVCFGIEKMQTESEKVTISMYSKIHWQYLYLPRYPRTEIIPVQYLRDTNR